MSQRKAQIPCDHPLSINSHKTLPHRFLFCVPVVRVGGREEEMKGTVLTIAGLFRSPEEKVSTD